MHAHRIRKASKKLGLKPGSVVYVGKDRAEEVQIEVIDYNATEYVEKEHVSIEECSKYLDSKTISWINVDGIHNTELIEKLGERFGIHPLIQEDIVNTGHRPKIEISSDNIFIVVKMLYADENNGKLKAEQVSIVFSSNWLFTFQETGEDVLDIVRNRVKNTVPRLRFIHSDYLAYTLLDAIVDHYFIVLEQLGDKLEILDDAISNKPEPKHINDIRELKKQLIFVRKAIWPLREVIGGLERNDSKLIHEITTPYIRDLYEHTIQVIDTVETYRDMVSNLLDLYHTGLSNRMNEIMKVLTIFASIFIPLGFLAGVYGMNFDTSVSPFNLPELGYKYGYLFFWGLVCSVAGGLLWFFRRKNWL